MPAVLQGECDSEGWYCPECIRHWTRDPLSKKEKTELKEPLHIAQIRKITKEGAAGVKCPVSGKRLMVDSFSASAMILIYDAIGAEHKVHFAGLSLLKAQSVSFKLIKKYEKVG
jgi:hypothetical protein